MTGLTDNAVEVYGWKFTAHAATHYGKPYIAFVHEGREMHSENGVQSIPEALKVFKAKAEKVGEAEFIRLCEAKFNKAKRWKEK